MSPSTPQVSVVIPCHNNDRYVGECIDSVLSQTGVDVEVIVVDDGSTDESRSVIQSYGDRIRPLFQKQSGACAARNAGLGMVGTPYVKFLDADDQLLPESLRPHYDDALHLAEQNPAYTLFGDGWYTDAKGEPYQKWFFPQETEEGEVTLSFIVRNTIITGAPLHQTERLRRVGGFSQEMPAAQDWELSLRLYFSGVRFFYRKVPCFAYRQHQTTERISTKKHPATSFLQRFEGYNRILELAYQSEGKPLPSELAHAFARVYWNTGRFSIRCQHPDVAKQFFAQARSLTNRSYVSGNRIYRTMVHLLGPRWAEKVASLKNRFGR